ncbi:hypothetical protein H7Y40_01550 [Pedobacter sp.]|nr:hypothetical protein [Candidatus Saccharibacteria bacterium]
MKKTILLLTMITGLALFIVPSVSAVSLKMQPLLYSESIAKGDTKKGFIDISNPTGQTIKLQSSVQAFRQTDDNGSLQFYDNEQVSAGIIPDLKDFELGPREAIRMYFLIDGTKLPPGDVFAAIFVATKGQQESRGVAESVRLGTILTIVNGTAGARQAAIESLSTSWFQFGTAIAGNYRVKNTADPTQTTGFYPDVTVAVTPFTSSVVSKAPLVTAGKSREGSFSLQGDRFGIYKLTASYGDSQQSRWVFVVTGFWQWLAPLLVVIIIFALFLLRPKRHKSRYFRAP